MELSYQMYEFISKCDGRILISFEHIFAIEILLVTIIGQTYDIRTPNTNASKSDNGHFTFMLIHHRIESKISINKNNLNKIRKIRQRN